VPSAEDPEFIKFFSNGSLGLQNGTMHEGVLALVRAEGDEAGILK